MSEVGVEARNTVMIGDTVFDVLMGINADVCTFGVNWGYHDAEKLKQAGARYILNTFDELKHNLELLWIDS